MSIPISTSWILTRSKTKDDQGESYYGAYPSGFLERVRNTFLNGSRSASILHVCGGFARNYNTDKLWAFGENDVTIDIDPETKPDICLDVREMSKKIAVKKDKLVVKGVDTKHTLPNLILIDRPYGEEEAVNYNAGPEVCPNLNNLTRDCLFLAKQVSDQVAVLVFDYYWPYPGNNFQEYAAIGVFTGRNNKARVLTAWRNKFEEPKN